MKNETRTYEAMAGENISRAWEEAVKLAKRHQCGVGFDFNGIKLTALPSTEPAKMVESYHAECGQRREKHIASPEYKAQQAEYEDKQRKRKSALASALVGAPEHMSLADAEVWRKACDANKDGYGGAVMTYAERWARLMECRMAKGEKLASIANECSDLANEEGITGFMYGCAVSILSKAWKHGEALRLWHNLKTQLGTEGQKANETGAVLNPALLRMG